MATKHSMSTRRVRVCATLQGAMLRQSPMLAHMVWCMTRAAREKELVESTPSTPRPPPPSHTGACPQTTPSLCILPSALRGQGPFARALPRSFKRCSATQPECTCTRARAHTHTHTDTHAHTRHGPRQNQGVDHATWLRVSVRACRKRSGQSALLWRAPSNAQCRPVLDPSSAQCCPVLGLSFARACQRAPKANQKPNRCHSVWSRCP